MSLAAQFREKAKQQIEGSVPLFDPALLAEPQKLALFIVGQVNATVYNALADMLDYQVLTPEQEKRQAFLKAVTDRHAAIRNAAAKGAATGDWSEYDRLINEPDHQPPT